MEGGWLAATSPPMRCSGGALLSAAFYCMVQSGSLIVVSGPSGSGKSTLTASAIHDIPNLKYSVSHTTRPPREGEAHGVNYFFVTEPEFKKLIQTDEFLEWATVYGNYYGTSKRFIAEALKSGVDVVLDIDVQGAKSVKDLFPDSTLIFILPPSYEALMQRLQTRGLDTEEVVKQRLAIARQEILRYDSYDYLIINENLEQAEQELKSIIIASRCRRGLRDALAQRIVQTFNQIPEPYKDYGKDT